MVKSLFCKATRETKISLSKGKKVVMGETTGERHPHSLAHMSLYDRLMVEIDKMLEHRNKMVVYEEIDGEMVNVTPQPIKISFRTERFEKLDRKYKSLQMMSDITEIMSFKSVTSSVIRSKSSRAVGVRMSLEDVITGASLIPCNQVELLFLIIFFFLTDWRRTYSIGFRRRFVQTFMAYG